jgi:multiple antibiotic resistance protein
VQHIPWIKAFVGLLAIVNPIGNAALFLSMTSGSTPVERRRVAATTAVAVAITLALCVVAGSAMLEFFGIDVDDLRLAGGLVVLTIGLSMLRAQQSPAHGGAAETAEGAQKDSPAVVPLAIPMVAGPGAMATAIVFAHEVSGWLEKGVLIGVVLANAAIVYVAFRVATPLQRGLGVSGMNVVVRIMGLVLSAIAMDMLVAGLRGSFPSLAA